MNHTKEAALLLSSLSVYKGILQRSVPKAYLRLLNAIDGSCEEFADCWGSFFSLLCDRGYADNLLGCLTDTLLFDENAFSREAAAGRDQQLPEVVREAARRDIAAVFQAGNLTAEEVLEDFAQGEELGAVADSLPRWNTGKANDIFDPVDQVIRRLAVHYRTNGCGMFARYRAFIWRNGDIQPVEHPDMITLSSLKGYELPRRAVVENTAAFLEGAVCNNCLLYGDMGTGKSSTVKAVLNEFYTRGLRMVEMPKDRLSEFPLLVDRIASVPLNFIVFIDDLSFSGEDKSYAQLKAVLEGGLAARPDNTLIYATSNRRHLIKESFVDRDGDDIHRNDTMQETLSLSDRFGLSVNFSKPDKQEYLEIVLALARDRGLSISEEELISGAERWATGRSGRSPRCARQYIAYMESKRFNKRNEEKQ